MKAEQFNQKHPVGSKLIADVYVGRSVVTVTHPAYMEGTEAVFKGNYGTTTNALILVDWVVKESEVQHEN